MYETGIAAGGSALILEHLFKYRVLLCKRDSENASEVAPSSKENLYGFSLSITRLLLAAASAAEQKRAALYEEREDRGFMRSACTSACPFPSAKLRAVRPLLSLAPGTAPRSRRSLHASTCPPFAAECSAVRPGL